MEIQKCFTVHDYSKEKPAMGVEVLAFSEAWISKENPIGYRIGFVNFCGSFTSAVWDEQFQVYASEHNSDPELWMELDHINNNHRFINE